MLERYVVVDLEMTGLNPRRDRILEIGAARVFNVSTACLSKDSFSLIAACFKKL